MRAPIVRPRARRPRRAGRSSPSSARTPRACRSRRRSRSAGQVEHRRERRAVVEPGLGLDDVGVARTGTGDATSRMPRGGTAELLGDRVEVGLVDRSLLLRHRCPDRSWACAALGVLPDSLTLPQQLVVPLGLARSRSAARRASARHPLTVAVGADARDSRPRPGMTQPKRSVACCLTYAGSSQRRLLRPRARRSACCAQRSRPCVPGCRRAAPTTRGASRCRTRRAAARPTAARSPGVGRAAGRVPRTRPWPSCGVTVARRAPRAPDARPDAARDRAASGRGRVGRRDGHRSVRPPSRGKARGAGDRAAVADLLLDPQELVVLRDAIGSDGAPVLIWPQLVATAMSAIVVSSVSPERWLYDP